MSDVHNEMLGQLLSDAIKAGDHLQYSLDKCAKFKTTKTYSEEELESLEALTSRFERLSDIIVHKLLKGIYYLDMEKSLSIRHVLLKSEKKNIIDDHNLFLRIRELRNIIAHDYVNENINEIIKSIQNLSTPLLSALASIKRYIQA